MHLLSAFWLNLLNFCVKVFLKNADKVGNTEDNSERENMGLQINPSKLTAASLQTEKHVEAKKQEAKESLPQTKEHCSSKAGKAIRSVALGLMLAAGIASAGKPMKANAAENAPADNQTTVTQEAETNVAKTDVEMAVDKAMDESEGKTTKLHVGDKNQCYGKMVGSFSCFDGRDYDSAAITSGGCLVFYNEIETTKSDGSKSTQYIPVNSFDLQTQPDGKSIELKTGTRFEESTKTNGDYVELAEDGRTFNVYNSEGEKIGHVKADTPDTFKTKVLVGVGLAGVAGAGYLYTQMKKDD